MPAGEKYYFKCLSCQQEFSQKEVLFSCPSCSGKLDVRMNIERIRINRQKLLSNQDTNPLTRYFDFYPLTKKENLTDVGLCRTPLIDAGVRLARACGSRLVLKNEMVNPSGTFKIRPLSVGFNYGMEKKRAPRIFTIASCGNAADALASLAARGGERLVIFVPENANPDRLSSLVIKGAQVFKVRRVRGELGDPTYKLMRQGVRERGWIPVPSSGLDNCAQIEGGKSISFEAIEQMDFSVPDHVVVQVGGGGLLNGIIKGFFEFFKLGLIDRLPRIHAVQSTGCAPLVRSWKKFEKIKPKSIAAAEKVLAENSGLMTAWKNPGSAAEGILDDVAYDYQYCIKGLFQTRGIAITVSDTEIRHAQALVTKNTGLFPCPTGSVGVAGAIKLAKAGIVKGKDRTLVILTGTGYKQLDTVEQFSKRVPTVSKFLEVEKRL